MNYTNELFVPKQILKYPRPGSDWSFDVSRI